MVKKALLCGFVFFSAFGVFGQGVPSTTPEPGKPWPQPPTALMVSAEQKLAVAQEQKQILQVGAEVQKVLAQAKDLQARYDDLQKADAAAQKQMQASVEAIFASAGDPKHEKFDFDPERLELRVKPAPDVSKNLKKP